MTLKALDPPAEVFNLLSLLPCLSCLVNFLRAREHILSMVTVSRSHTSAISTKAELSRDDAAPLQWSKSAIRRTRSRCSQENSNNHCSVAQAQRA